MASNYLSPVLQMVFNELQKNPGIEFKRDDQRLVNLGKAYNYKETSIAFALWILERDGHISKTRRGPRVYFYYSTKEKTTHDGNLKYTVTYTKDEDGFTVASVPALPGCHSQGRTKEEAQRNIREAMRGYLASMKHHGRPIPKEEVEQVEVPI